MADNVVAGAAVGTGPTFRTDDVGAGVQVPFAKLMDGTDGSSAIIPGDATNGLFVQVKATAAPATLPLPSGAATAAKQPALGTAGASSADVITVQGRASMTPLLVDGSGATQPVSGSVTVSGTVTANAGSGTMAISAAALPLPSGAATLAKQPALGTAGSASADVISVQGVASMTPLLVNASGNAVPITDNGGNISVDDGAGSLTIDAPVGTPAFVRLSDGSAAITTLPVSAASLPLPSGAATLAKQPALGTAGSASADVITVQGITSMTALKVDGSGVTQPVSVASIPSHAVTNAGTFVVQENGSALTSLQTIDNIVYNEDVAAVSGDPGVPIFAVRRDSATSGVSTDGDYANLSVDSTGALRVTGGGGGTQFAEDSAHTSGDSGTLVFAVRRDANTSLVDTTGDYAPIQVDASGSVKVAITSGAGSGGTSIADKAAFTEGSTSLTPVGGVYNETISSDPTEDQAAAFRITAKRALHVNLRDASGNELASGAQFAEDAAHTTGDLGTLALVRRSDAAASSSGTDGDYSTMNTDSSGRLWVNASGVAVPVTDNSGSLTVDNAGTFAVQAAQSGTWTVQPGNTANTTAWKVDGSAVTQPVSISGNQAVNVAQINGVTPLMGAGNTGTGSPRVTIATDQATIPVSLSGNQAVNIAQMNGVTTTMGNGVAGTGVQRVAIASDNTAFNVIAAGAAAHNAALSGNPVRIGARAVSADYTAATTGNTADIITDLNGKQIVLIGSIPENFVDGVTAAITGTGDTSVIATSGAGIRTYINQITVTNSHATVGTLVEIKDGSTVRYRGYAAPAGGGFTITLPTPLRGTANTAWNAANVTTGSNTYVSMAGYKAP